MRITGFTIQNFGSIRNVEFTGLGDRVVMVGPNGSGKTFVIQGLELLFGEFACRNGDSAISNVDYLWHKRRTDVPIAIGAILELEPSDVSHLQESGMWFRRPDGSNQIDVSRQLHYNKGWETVELGINGDSIIRNDQSTGVILADSEPIILAQIESLMKSAFVLISPSLPPTKTQGRPIEISGQTMNDVRQVSQGTELGQEARWARFSDAIEELLSWRFEPQAAEPLVRRGGYRLPSRHLGSGEQRIVDIVWQLQRDVPIIALEEPEFRLHPGLARRLANSLRKIAPDSQILISTHASQMVDRAEITNNWILSLDGEATDATQVKEADDFQVLLQNLGAFPSDIFLKDFILFLEGGSEAQAVAPAWAKTLGLEINENLNIGLVSIGGAGRLKDNLRIWLEQARMSTAAWHVVLDNHVANDIQELCQELEIPTDCITLLPEHCIEDFYPTELVLEGLKSIYDIGDVTHQKVSPKPRDQSIERVLQEHDKLSHGWKVALGMFIASRMSEQQIPHEFKKVVELIKVKTNH